MEFIYQPATQNRLGDFLLENLSRDWPVFRAAIAFVKKSGTKHIADALLKFAETSSAKFVVGIDHRGTSKEGLEQLLNGVGADGYVRIFNNPSAFTFHPKIYLFRSDAAAEVLVGSGNLTEGGIFTNYEASLRIKLDLTASAEEAFLKSIEDILDDWSDLTKGTARQLDEDLLSKLVARGDVPIEALVASSEEAADNDDTNDESNDLTETDSEVHEPLFKGHPVPKAPSVAGQQQPKPKAATNKHLKQSGPAATKSASSTTISSSESATTPQGNRGFVMTLQKTDVGKGQTSAGTAARSPEIFIPLKARDTDPDFWGWPDSFVDSEKKYDRSGVRMSFGGAQEITVNIMGWKLKKDLRLRHETLRSGGAVGDILRMEIAPPDSEIDYYVEIVKKGTTLHPVYLARCTEDVPHSFKKFGYY